MYILAKTITIDRFLPWILQQEWKSSEITTSLKKNVIRTECEHICQVHWTLYEIGSFLPTIKGNNSLESKSQNVQWSISFVYRK